MKHIEKFVKISEKIARKEKKDLIKLNLIGENLLEEYKNNGFIKKLPLNLLEIDAYSFIPLLKYLLEKNNNSIKSPVESEPNSNWMVKSSFCFVNIRGVGKDNNKTGNFIDAIKFLPSLRVNGIHLAPFFECSLSIVYAINSLNTINLDCINTTFLEYGMTGEEQVKFFIDFCHLLGMTVGFDIEPHTSQFSRIVIENPELFRWLKLDKNKKLIDDEESLLQPQNQQKICDEIKTIVNDILKENNLKSLEENGKYKLTKEVHLKITHKLIDEGFWTIPSHTWKGAGLPEFDKYNTKDNYPEFKYLSWDKENHLEHSFGVLTPFKFYDNIPINKIP
ncbi:MAG TPA: hypothetical protein PK771_05850, partial [Spirochaetota bacterium]|nr:hypothetical protein [Spirochaetota bacterium]